MGEFVNESKQLCCFAVGTINKNERSCVIYQREATTFIYIDRSMCVVANNSVKLNNNPQFFQNLGEFVDSLLVSLKRKSPCLLQFEEIPYRINNMIRRSTAMKASYKLAPSKIVVS